VDLCAQASLGVIDFEYCGADIPTCEGTTTLGVGDIIPPPTDGDAIKTLLNKLICFLFCYDLGFQLLPPELQCSEAKNVNELLGAPPIEIVPWDGTAVELDFGSVCDTGTLDASVGGGTCAAEIDVQGSFGLGTEVSSITDEVKKSIKQSIATGIGSSLDPKSIMLSLMAGSTNAQYDINVASTESAAAVSGNLNSGIMADSAALQSALPAGAGTVTSVTPAGAVVPGLECECTEYRNGASAAGERDLSDPSIGSFCLSVDAASGARTCHPLGSSDAQSPNGWCDSAYEMCGLQALPPSPAPPCACTTYRNGAAAGAAAYCTQFALGGDPTICYPTNGGGCSADHVICDTSIYVSGSVEVADPALGSISGPAPTRRELWGDVSSAWEDNAPNHHFLHPHTRATDNIGLTNGQAVRNYRDGHHSQVLRAPWESPSWREEPTVDPVYLQMVQQEVGPTTLEARTQLYQSRAAALSARSPSEKAAAMVRSFMERRAQSFRNYRAGRPTQAASSPSTYPTYASYTSSVRGSAAHPGLVSMAAASDATVAREDHDDPSSSPSPLPPPPSPSPQPTQPPPSVAAQAEMIAAAAVAQANSPEQAAQYLERDETRTYMQAEGVTTEVIALAIVLVQQQVASGSPAPSHSQSSPSHPPPLQSWPTSSPTDGDQASPRSRLHEARVAVTGHVASHPRMAGGFFLGGALLLMLAALQRRSRTSDPTEPSTASIASKVRAVFRALSASAPTAPSVSAKVKHLSPLKKMKSSVKAKESPAKFAALSQAEEAHLEEEQKADNEWL